MSDTDQDRYEEEEIKVRGQEPVAKKCLKQKGKVKTKVNTNNDMGYTVVDPEMASRVVQLLSEPSVATFYPLAAYYALGFSALARDTHRDTKLTVLRCLPLIYLVGLTFYTAAFRCKRHCGYAKFVLLGVVASVGAEGLLSWGHDHFTQAVAAHSVAVLAYCGALATKYRGGRVSWLLVPAQLVGLAALAVAVTGYLPALLLLGYGLLTSVAAFLALARFERERTAPAYLGVCGILLLQAAHVLLALAEFAPSFVCLVGPELVTMTYYMAQLGIALSVHFC